MKLASHRQPILKLQLTPELLTLLDLIYRVYRNERK